MKLGGVVILYNPVEDDVVKNINTYVPYLNRLVVIANSTCSADFINRVTTLSPTIDFISNNYNEGISRPLNKALATLSNSFKWILTMDQDSFFEEVQARAYFSEFEKKFYLSQKVAIVSPNHNTSTSTTFNVSLATEVVKAITSGSLVNTSICERLGGFDERLFIDEVDHEYCYRAIIAGYKIVEFANIRLNHNLGTQKQAGYFSVIKKSNRTLHSPLRVYYMVRNYLYVSSKYKRLLPEEFRERRKGLIVTLKNNLLFSGNFFKMIVAVIKGYLHFKMNKFS